MSARPAPFDRKTRRVRFLARRRNRIAAHAGLAAVVGLLGATVDRQYDIAAGLRMVATSDPGALLDRITPALLLYLLPALLVIAIATVLFALGGALVGLATALLPRQVATLVDGVAQAVMVVLVLEATGVSEIIRGSSFGSLANLALIWALFVATSGLLWNLLPIGLTHRSRAAREIAVPLHEARRRLVPGRDLTATLADAALQHSAGPMPDYLEPVAVQRDAFDRYRMSEPESRSPWRDLTFALSEPAPGHTRIEVAATLAALSPLALWDFATRPYGEDYLDHLEARLLGETDRSTYGALIARFEKRAAKKAKAGPAPA